MQNKEMNFSAENGAYFLGGHDLEMETIKELLLRSTPDEQVFDHNLDWGARTSDYQEQIESCSAKGLTPVLIELAVTSALPEDHILIDHHNDRSGNDQPTSLEQLFELLQLPRSEWSRWFSLVAANDRGHIPELVKIGATTDELSAIRKMDRRAQGVSEWHEAEAKHALNEARTYCDGRLTVVHIPHERSSAVADFIDPHLGGPGFLNLLVCSTRTVSFYGAGSLIQKLTKLDPNSWFGGALPERGYWGSNLSCDDVLKFIRMKLSQDQLQGRTVF